MGDIAALEKQLNIKTKQIAQLQVKMLRIITVSLLW